MTTRQSNLLKLTGGPNDGEAFIWKGKTPPNVIAMPHVVELARFDNEDTPPEANLETNYYRLYKSTVAGSPDNPEISFHYCFKEFYDDND